MYDEPARDEIEQRAFRMWQEQGELDGEQIVNYGLGKKKLCDYHWLVAKMLVNMETDARLRKLGPVKVTMDEGFFYCPYVPFPHVPLLKTPPVPDKIDDSQVVPEGVDVDPAKEISLEEFSPRKGIMTRYGKKLLRDGAKHYKRIEIKDLDVAPTERVTMEIRPIPAPDWIEIDLSDMPNWGKREKDG